MRVFTTVLLLYFLSIPVGSFSLDFLIPYRKGNLWGYANDQGTKLTEIKYTRVSWDGKNQSWFVYADRKMGVVNQLGIEVIPPMYDSLVRDVKYSGYHDYYSLHEGKRGYVLKNGRVLLNPMYTYLWSSEYPRKEMEDPYNFFVSDDQKIYTLIDSSGNAVLKNITAVDEENEGNYLLRVGTKWGYYNAGKQTWYLEPLFDTIGRLNPTMENPLKAGFESYYYFAMKGTEIFLLPKKGPAKSFGKRSLESFYDEVLIDYMVDEVFLSEGMPEEASISDLTSVKELVYGSGGDQELNIRRLGGFETIILLRRDGKLGLRIYYYNTEYFLEPIYEDFYFVQQHGFIREPFVVARRNSKWGLYSLKMRYFVVPLAMDEIRYDPHGHFLLIKEGKTGMYIPAGNKRVVDLKINPEFDEYLEQRKFWASDDTNAHFFVYYFKCGNQLCGVGQNGVRFFEGE